MSTVLLRLLLLPVCCEAGGGLWVITRCAEVNSFLFISIFPFSDRREPVPFVKNTLSDEYVGIILGMGRGENNT